MHMEAPDCPWPGYASSRHIRSWPHSPARLVCYTGALPPTHLQVDLGVAAALVAVHDGGRQVGHVVARVALAWGRMIKKQYGKGEGDQ